MGGQGGRTTINQYFDRKATTNARVDTSGARDWSQSGVHVAWAAADGEMNNTWDNGHYGGSGYRATDNNGRNDTTDNGSRTCDDRDIEVAASADGRRAFTQAGVDDMDMDFGAMDITDDDAQLAAEQASNPSGPLYLSSDFLTHEPEPLNLAKWTHDPAWSARVVVNDDDDDSDDDEAMKWHEAYHHPLVARQCGLPAEARHLFLTHVYNSRLVIAKVAFRYWCPVTWRELWAVYKDEMDRWFARLVEDEGESRRHAMGRQSLTFG